jgi:serine-type D-Ala-D-Ala carboxypeptidase/endopeptidase (penicillin-binding protein 4)
LRLPGAPRGGLKVALCALAVACAGVPVLASPLGRRGAADASPSFRNLPSGSRRTTPDAGRRRERAARPAPPATGRARRPWWERRLDHLAGGNMAVAVALDGRRLYGRGDRRRRRPASNQKLLLSMALLDSFGRGDRVVTTAAVPRMRDGIVLGDLWVGGRGDPTIAGGGRYGGGLGQLRPTYLGRLARRIAAAGITRIRGRVRGSRGYFAHDWSAPGWRPYYRSLYIALPSALTFNGNVARGRYIRNPEHRLAAALSRRLERRGIEVAGGPGAGHPPGHLRPIARVRSAPLSKLLRYMNRTSSNFFAEVLGKRLGAVRRGPAGTIAKGARVLRRWARGRGIEVVAHDSSGLSHANRISARGLVRLLHASAAAPWGGVLRRSLASPGQGTLEDRLGGVRVRAKTGTLVGVSALSGWVWLERRDAWAEFSILSSGGSKARAVEREDAIVRLLAARAG